MDNIVISIGGSVLLSEDNNKKYYKKLKNLLLENSKKYKLFLVVGGGKTAREYIKIGRSLNLSEENLDLLGIEMTRVNAKLLSMIIFGSDKKIPEETKEVINQDNNITIMGGTIPGHSTDKVAAELAEKIDASKFIIATNVDGVYTKDPNKFKDAKQIKEIKIDELIKKYGTDWKKAGENIVIDGPALKIISRLRNPVFILNGKKINQLNNAINGNIFNGTIIKK